MYKFCRSKFNEIVIWACEHRDHDRDYTHYNGVVISHKYCTECSPVPEPLGRTSETWNYGVFETDFLFKITSLEYNNILKIIKEYKDN